MAVTVGFLVDVSELTYSLFCVGIESVNKTERAQLFFFNMTIIITSYQSGLIIRDIAFTI